MTYQPFLRLFQKRITWLAIIGIIILVVGICLCLPSEPETEPNPEELRVMASQRIDSTAVQTWAEDTTVVMMMHDADSVGVRDLLGRLSAEAWILVEDSTGMLISARNANKRMYPASLTKMMTCMLALERGQMNDSIEITEDVFLVKDSRVRLGDGYLLGDMILEMMMQSDNDAANAIAKHIAGEIPVFCQLMTSKAVYLGMDSTHFANPNGMPNDSTYSSARDLLVLSRYCMRDSAFAKIAGTASTDIPLTDGRHLSSQNTNLLLGSYEGCIGVKTGFTRKAGYCLSSAATRNGVTLFLVLLNSRSQSSRFTESAALLDYGFRIMAQEATKKTSD